MNDFTIKPDKRFQPFVDDLKAHGLGNYVYESEMWFYDQGLEIFQKRADTIHRVDDPQDSEVLFHDLFYKHFGTERKCECQSKVIKA